jgi:GDPmannose 4,6-dehydratase
VVDIAFGYVNLDWRNYVEFDQRYLRPAEVDLLIGDPAKAKKQLGWEPSVTFQELVHLMVNADLQAVGLSTPGNGKAKIEDYATIRQNLAGISF